ncbi:CDP-glycerol glycerophosphotransferase family protein [Desulfitobacterium hafniense]|uniref:CDP-glycerol glycerophosphotransferase family protein n=1 Tax=Desulfitobacterium hafniense TaxID=49338 RepID=UPI0003651A20|nr:CDP-glycerol glycerophosphotransferase family protein [Desulfitobacterium hafniense]
MMKLKKRTLKQLTSMRPKKPWIIYGCNEWSKQVLTEAGIVSEVAYLIDENSYLWGTLQQIGENEFRIDSPKLLATLDVFDYHILIAAAYHELLYENLQKILGADKPLQIYYCQADEDIKLSRFKPLFTKFKVKNRIVFRSGPERGGDYWDYADNARALFEYMTENQYNDKYELIWAVEDVSKYRYLEKIKNVKVISYRDAQANNLLKAFVYQYYLYTAKFFLFTETCIWLRFHRKDQILINLWHGCGFKNRKSKTEPTGPHYDFMTVTSQMYADIHADIFGCRKEQMLITGLAKEDWVFHPVDGKLADLLNIKDCRKYIVWLPTFRKTINGMERLSEDYALSETELPILETFECLREIDGWLEDHDIFIVIKLHPIQAYSRQDQYYNNIKVMTHDEFMKYNIPINRLLAKTDALITDYSSVAVDYMLLDKPIAFTLDDLDEYESGRGFIFDHLIDFLPGKTLYTKDDFLLFLHEIAKGIDNSKDQRHELFKVMHKYGDDNNCQRILDLTGISR